MNVSKGKRRLSNYFSYIFETFPRPKLLTRLQPCFGRVTSFQRLIIVVSWHQLWCWSQQIQMKMIMRSWFSNKMIVLRSLLQCICTTSPKIACLRAWRVLLNCIRSIMSAVPWDAWKKRQNRIWGKSMNGCLIRQRGTSSGFRRHSAIDVFLDGLVNLDFKKCRNCND